MVVGSRMRCGRFLLAVVLLGCGTSVNLRGDAADGDATDVSSSDVRDDAAPDVADDHVGEADTSEEALVPPLEELPVCGNGILDLGEECDDRNRLNGDGCDWSCRLGDGESLPEPDPTTADYAPAGDAVPVGDPETTMIGDAPAAELPLVWTGSEFAAAYRSVLGGREPGPIRFRRFDKAGFQLDAEWEYDVPSAPYDGHDLVWTGDGFGLFFIDEARGVLYLRLEADGKPMGEPVVVEPDPWARAPTAAWTSAGRFVLAWTVQNPGVFFSACGGSEDGSGAVRVKHVARDGTAGAAATVVEAAGPPLNLAGANETVGLVYGQRSAEDACRVLFVRLADDLSGAAVSGVLTDRIVSSYHRLPVVWDGVGYAVAWMTCPVCEYPDADYRLCVARFGSSGELVAAPICNPFQRGFMAGGQLAMAAGDLGYLVLLQGPTSEAEPWPALRFARLDGHGRMLSSSPQLLEPRLNGLSEVLPFEVAWADDGFGALYGNSPGGMPLHVALFFEFLRRTSP